MKKIYVVASKDIDIAKPYVKVFASEVDARRYFYHCILIWMDDNENANVVEERMSIESKYIGLSAEEGKGIEIWFDVQDVEY